MSVLRIVSALFLVPFFLGGGSLRAAERVGQGIVVLYEFEEGKGDTVHDRSGVGTPVDLKIETPKAVTWKDGAIEIHGSALIVSPQSAAKVSDAVKRSNEITIEAWLKPAALNQSGPARIVSLSRDPNARNFTLGQDNDFYDVRFRTPNTDANGNPSTSSPKKSLETRLTHVIYTRDGRGMATVYLDGKQVASKSVSGNLKNWDSNFRLSLGNEVTKDRPWKGEFHLVAIYERALSPQQVQQNFQAGPGAETASNREMSVADAKARHFQKDVAPILAKHCLECHDSAIKKGDLDLSVKTAAFQGGESGKAIVPGKVSDSPLWEYVASNDMPKDRAPLSDQEKDVLKKWIADGAVWEPEVIDPANYRHSAESGQVWIQRLTIPEYIATVRAATGVDISKEANDLLPKDLRADGFSNTAYNLGVDLKHVEAYGQLASIIVDRMDIRKFAGRFSKSKKLSTDDTMRDHVAAMGKWLLRGPLDQRDINVYSGIATTVASAGGDFEEANRYMIEAMLQSPRFLYRVEYQKGDGTERWVGPYELANRMSYILWGASPDEDLFQAAEKGDLADLQKVRSQVDRMLKDPRAIDRSEQFLSEWLNLNRLDNLRPAAEKFPKWNAELAQDMKRETLAYFREVVWKENRPLTDLLNAQYTFLTPRLAKFYGLDSPSDTFGKYDLKQTSSRGGLLTHASVLTIGGDEASMVSRGLFVLHDLLRGTVNAPPPCVNTTPPPTKPGLTQRAIAESRIANVNCGVCHARFEPLAFGLEKFDGIGAYHDQDRHGNTLRDDGDILFPGTAEPVKYSSSQKLMNLLAASDRVRESLTWKVTQFAIGRPLTADDASTVAEIHRSAQENGGTYSALITSIVLSDLVQKTRTETAVAENR